MRMELSEYMINSFAKTKEKIQKALLKQPKSVSLEQARDQVARYKKVLKIA